MPKLYTGTGDSGFTKTLCGIKLKKNDPSIIAIGKIDSLQAALDEARSECKNKTMQQAEDLVQEKLWQTCGEISFGRTGGPVKSPVEENDVRKLEGWIDGLCEGKEFKHFIRFRNKAAIAFNEARVRSREAEIALLPMLEGKKLRPVAFKFFNRLGGWLYAVACKFEKR